MDPNLAPQKVAESMYHAVAIVEKFAKDKPRRIR